MSDLTKKKISVIKRVIEESPHDKNCYEMFYLRDGKTFQELCLNSDCQIHLFDYSNGKKCDPNMKYHSLQFIYENENALTEITINKLISYITPKNLRKLTKCDHYLADIMYNKCIDNIIWTDNKCYTYVYINTEIKILDNVDFLDKPLYMRIMTDVQFGEYNPNKIKTIFGMKDIHLVKLDYQYENIDFDKRIGTDSFNLKISNSSSYELELVLWNGEKYVSDSYNSKRIPDKINLDFNICREILHQNYMGTPKAFSGYRSYLSCYSYVLIVLHPALNKYMLVVYSMDDSSCAGIIFTLATKLYDSLEKLWTRTNKTVKKLILKEMIVQYKANLIKQ